MLERLANHSFFCFLDEYSGYHQISIHPNDQSKTTITCPYGTYAYLRMSFGLCNTLASFRRCMMCIFSYMIGEIMEVFMDNFSVYGKTFDPCLENQDRILQWCQEKDLMLNWDKCHFMVREGIVLGHLISELGLDVDKAKIEVIEKLPPPINVKVICSFLGHAGFYRPFVKDFSQITRPTWQRKPTNKSRARPTYQPNKQRRYQVAPPGSADPWWLPCGPTFHMASSNEILKSVEEASRHYSSGKQLIYL